MTLQQSIFIEAGQPHGHILLNSHHCFFDLSVGDIIIVKGTAD